MSDRARSDAAEVRNKPPLVTSSRPPDSVPRLVPGPVQAKALALQRAAGNRAASRVLSRWAPHPDKDKKGQFMTDRMAAEWNRLNPPLSK
jgi:hypothetical protein